MTLSLRACAPPLLLGLLLNACATPAATSPRAGRADEDPPRLASTERPPVAPLPTHYEPPSKRGNPKKYKVFGKTYKVRQTSAGYRKRGQASWYGPKFHGRLTSSGETYDMHEISAAHKSLPIPTFVKVTRVDTGQSLIVRVNDRGPFVDQRIIDLSYGAAQALGIVEQGKALVEVEALPPYQFLPGAKPPSLAQQPTPTVATATPTPKPTSNPTSEPTPEPRAALKLSSLRKPTLAAPEPAAVPLTEPLAEPSDDAILAPPGSTLSALPAPEIASAPTAYLQIAAYSQRESAERITRLLNGRLRRPAVVHSDNASTVHRVRIGPLPNVAAGNSGNDLDALKLQLAELGFADTYLVYPR